MSSVPPSTMPFSACHSVTPRTTVVFGRPLDIAGGECAVANVLLHKVDDTLFMVDSGAGPAFRAVLHGAVEALRPFRRIVLVNTHGHPDHVGNNSLIDEIEAESRAHMISLRERAVLSDPRVWAARLIEVAESALSVAAPQADDLLALFAPLEGRAEGAVAIESSPTHALDLGGALWEGWKPDPDFLVLRQHGHTAGHLAFYIPSEKLLFLGDESAAPYPAWPDSLPWASFAGLRNALRMARGGAIERLVDSHRATVYDPEAARRLLQGLVSEYQFLDHLVIDTLRKHPEGLDLDDLLAVVRASGAPTGPTPWHERAALRRKVADVGAQALDPEGRRWRLS